MSVNIDIVCDQLRQELLYAPQVRKVKINPFLYNQLCLVVDEIESDSVWGINIVEDPSVETYEIEY